MAAALPILSVLTVALSIFETIINALVKLFEYATPAQRERLLNLVIEILEWWQENVFRKIGDLLDGPD